MVVLVLCGSSCMAAPMGPGDATLAAPEPLHVRQLTTEELFKAMIVHDTELPGQ